LNLFALCSIHHLDESQQKFDHFGFQEPVL
jgi:hypothetical protein